MNISDVKFDANGLVCAVVQDFFTNQVLTVAYMNAEALQITLDEGRTCFYSRSRKTLWRKGETSGNVQRVVSITADCDADALVVKVIKSGPACHTGSESCFTNLLFSDGSTPDFSLQKLYDLLVSRKKELPEGSYTTYLFQKGSEKILKKIGEECAEVIIAGMKNERAETVYEIADLCYHVLVLMVQCGISVADIDAELASRSIIDHKVKQEQSRAKEVQ